VCGMWSVVCGVYSLQARRNGRGDRVRDSGQRQRWDPFPQPKQWCSLFSTDEELSLSFPRSSSRHIWHSLTLLLGITTVGGISSFAGCGGGGDYIVAAQAKKPQINVWQWGKPHALMQCHIQEITTAIATDTSGFYLCGGTKGGRLFLWELSSGALVQSWQAHFKALTTVTFAPCGNFLISTSEDGMVRVWDLVSLLNSSSDTRATSHSESSQIKSFSPYRCGPSPLLLSSHGSCAARGLLTLSPLPACISSPLVVPPPRSESSPRLLIELSPSTTCTPTDCSPPNPSLSPSPAAL
jgi:WD40 repeat protein